MNTIPEIIDTLGGTTEFGRAIGVRQSTASEMKRRQSIPVQHWPKVIEAARIRKIKLTTDDLVELHLKRGKAA